MTDAMARTATSVGPGAANSVLASLARFEGVEFLLTMPADEQAPCESWGLENAKEVAAWARGAQKRLRELGEKIGAGSLAQVTGFGLQRHWALAAAEQKAVAWRPTKPTIAKK